MIISRLERFEHEASPPAPSPTPTAATPTPRATPSPEFTAPPPPALTKKEKKKKKKKKKRRRIRRPAVARLTLWLAPILLDWYMWFVERTSRTTVFGEEYEGRPRNEVMLVAAFHQTMLYLLHHFRGREGVVMTSLSRDGDLLAAILDRFGMTPIRGSTNHGGREAREEMTRRVRGGSDAGLVCDGPRGPYGKVSVGIIRVARDSGVPIVACAVWTSRHFLLRSWDRTLVPLPFSRIYFAYGEPLAVPPEATVADCTRLSEELGDRIRGRMFAMQEKAGVPAQDFRVAVTAA